MCPCVHAFRDPRRIWCLFLFLRLIGLSLNQSLGGWAASSWDLSLLSPPPSPLTHQHTHIAGARGTHAHLLTRVLGIHALGSYVRSGSALIPQLQV